MKTEAEANRNMLALPDAGLHRGLPVGSWIHGPIGALPRRMSTTRWMIFARSSGSTRNRVYLTGVEMGGGGGDAAGHDPAPTCGRGVRGAVSGKPPEGDGRDCGQTPLKRSDAPVFRASWIRWFPVRSTRTWYKALLDAKREDGLQRVPVACGTTCGTERTGTWACFRWFDSLRRAEHPERVRFHHTAVPLCVGVLGAARPFHARRTGVH